MKSNTSNWILSIASYPFVIFIQLKVSIKVEIRLNLDENKLIDPGLKVTICVQYLFRWIIHQFLIGLILIEFFHGELLSLYLWNFWYTIFYFKVFKKLVLNMAFIKFSRILKNIYIYYFSIGIIIDKIFFSKILIQFKNIINHSVLFIRS